MEKPACQAQAHRDDGRPAPICARFDLLDMSRVLTSEPLPWARSRAVSHSPGRTGPRPNRRDAPELPPKLRARPAGRLGRHFSVQRRTMSPQHRKLPERIRSDGSPRLPQRSGVSLRPAWEEFQVMHDFSVDPTSTRYQSVPIHAFERRAPHQNAFGGVSLCDHEPARLPKIPQTAHLLAALTPGGATP